eukprot:jgi/Galph1/2493/GphlegSOOS_G1147.1
MLLFPAKQQGLVFSGLNMVHCLGVETNEMASRIAQLDLLLFVVSLTLELVALILDSRQPHLRPFFLEDASIWYEKASSSTVPFWLVPLVGFAGFVPCIFFVELISRRRTKTMTDAIFRALRLIINLTIAFLLAAAFTQAGKLYVGYLRPDFAHRCLDQSEIPLPLYNSSVIWNNEGCSSQQQGAINNGRKSFPSGHASSAMSLSFYFILYLVWKSTKVTSPWLAQLLQIFSLFPLGFGFYVGSSRIVDNRHHPADVVAGSVLGILFASILFWKTAVAIDTQDRTEEYLAARLEDGHEPIELAYY